MTLTGPAGEDAFRAVADPTRRAILDLLGSGGNLRAGEIAARFPHITRPAVSRHLRVLREARLLTSRGRGRELWYGLSAGQLQQVHSWVSRYEVYWAEKLDVLAALVEQEEETAARVQNQVARVRTEAAAQEAERRQRPLDPEGDSGAWVR